MLVLNHERSKDMGASDKLKAVMKHKHIKQIELAEQTGRETQTLRSMLYRDNMTYATVEALADALGCDIVLVDRKTRKQYR